MALNLTSATRVREPGFSASECLELARKIEQAGRVPSVYDIDCDRWNCEGRLDECNDGLSCREVANIVAALRAYAND